MYDATLLAVVAFIFKYRGTFAEQILAAVVFRPKRRETRMEILAPKVNGKANTKSGSYEK